MSDASVRKLAALQRPVELLVFVGEGCPFCAKAVENARQVEAASPQVRLEVVDAGREAERAAAQDVRSVPLLVIDGALRKTGVVSASDLATWVLELGGPEHEARMLASCLEEGRLDSAVDRILAPGGADAFARAWQGSVMALRMGLMAASEDVLERRPHALDDAVPALLATTSSGDVALRGDTADLLGRIRHPSARAVLDLLTEDPHPDVAEAAAEALEGLKDSRG